jgi:hypothetical protein
MWIFGGAESAEKKPVNDAENAAPAPMATEIALSSKYGSTLRMPMRPKTSPPKVRKTAASKLAFALAIAMPFMVYAIACSAMAFVYFYRPGAALGMVVACALIPMWFAMKAGKEIKATTAAERAELEEEKHHGNVLGLKTMLALVFGTGVGYFLYSEYFFVYDATKSAQIYTNVSPNMPGGGAALADAGRISFSSETWIDASRGVGYVGPGNVYCVAPVLDVAAEKDIEFWATGTCKLPVFSISGLSWLQPSCCCGERGLFHCGDVPLHPGKSKTALVDLFLDPAFHDAVKLSTAVNSLVSSEGALFLRFESDADSALEWIRYTGYILYGTGLLVCFAVNYIVATSLYNLM